MFWPALWKPGLSKHEDQRRRFDMAQIGTGIRERGM
jgi:hypothetical protein